MIEKGICRISREVKTCGWHEPVLEELHMREGSRWGAWGAQVASAEEKGKSGC